MSILIKNVGMPSSCICCPAVMRDTLTETIDDDRDALKVTRIYNCCLKPDRIADGWVTFSKACSSRREWCPLVELPKKHGRLVDADELKTAFPTCDNHMDIKIASVRATVNHAPTIVEAEGDEE